MTEQKALYGVRVGHIYFVGIGDAGFRVDSRRQQLMLEGVRVRALADPVVGMTPQSAYMLDEGYLRNMFDYRPDNDRIPSVTFTRNGIDQVVDFAWRDLQEPETPARAESPVQPPRARSRGESHDEHPGRIPLSIIPRWMRDLIR
ncbi:hypothetical protein HYW21_01110 [Candidatus Woesearchaeota archaeon]|nr:hypothetical protein [Candidatus Woesearchaeota archaeon]